MKSWISNLPTAEKDDMLFRMVESSGNHLGAEMKHRYLKSISSKTKSDSPTELRQVSDLLEAAEKFAAERERREAEKKKRKGQERKERQNWPGRNIWKV